MGKRFISIGCFAFVFLVSGYAQNLKMDSLRQLLLTTEKVERFNVLRTLIIECYETDLITALGYANEAIDLIPHVQDSIKIVRAYRTKGVLLVRLERHNEAVMVLKEPLIMARRNNYYEEITIILNLIGIANTYLGNYSQALEHYFEAIVLRESNDGIDLRYLFNNIGLIFYKIGNNDKALEYYKKSLLLYSETDSADWKLLVNIGLCYNQHKDYSSAIDYITRALRGINVQDTIELQIEGHFALGMTKYRMDELIQSEHHLNKSLHISRGANDPRFISESLNVLARIYLDTKRYRLAALVLKESESIATIHNYNALLLDFYSVFINLYSNQKDMQKLSSYYTKYISLLEQTHGDELRHKSATFLLDLEHHANLKTIAHQKEVVQLQAATINRTRLIYYGFAFLSLLLIASAVLLYFYVLQRKRINALLKIRISDRSEDFQKMQVTIIEEQHALALDVGETVRSISSALNYVRECKVMADRSPRQWNAVDFTIKELFNYTTAMEHLIKSSKENV